MSLWGANTASAADKPKWLNTLGDFYNKDNVVGANSSNLGDYPGAAHKGWIHEVRASTSRFNVNAGGSGYANGEMVIASNVGATNATAKIVTDGAGAILSTYAFSKGSANATNYTNQAIAITKKISAVVVSGSPVGYQNGAPILITGGGGSGADIRLVANASGAITNVVYNDKGTGFTSTPTAAIGQSLANIAIGNSGGTGYANGDIVNTSGGGGATQARGVITTDGSGAITAIALGANVGNNFTSAPTAAVVNSTGGATGGSGAVLTPNLPGSGATLNVTLGGSSANVALVADNNTTRVRRETLVAF